MRSVLRAKNAKIWIAAVAVLAVLLAGLYFLSDLLGPRALWSGGETRSSGRNASKQLTLDEVIELSRQGHQLHWDDFSQFEFYETGSGLYIRVYPIDEMFSLWIGGTGPDDEHEPIYMNLRANDGTDESMDIREEGVEAFIEEHKDNPVRGGSIEDLLSTAMP